MRIQTLDGYFSRQTVYIVGTGPSLRCLDLDFLKSQRTIGINQCWKYFCPDFSVTVHPELVQEYEAAHRDPFGPRTRWIVKKKPPMVHLELDDDKYYVFNTSYEVKVVRERPLDTLFLGEGAQTTAMDAAARMGAAAIVLVGCDAASLEGDFHGHDQHVRWVGRKPDDQYRLYRESTASVRSELRKMGVPVMTLSPFIGLAAAAEDYRRLKGELGLNRLPTPKDISPKNWKPPKKKSQPQKSQPQKSQPQRTSAQQKLPPRTPPRRRPT